MPTPHLSGPLREEALAERLRSRPVFALGELPTPLRFAPRFSARAGREVWIKRDDLTAAALGGNKVRKLSYLLGDALSSGATALVSVGSAQSNHARTVAAAAAMARIGCHLVLGGVRPDRPTGNLLLDALFGAQLHFPGTDDWDELEKYAAQLAGQLRDAGKRPYLIPLGGSTPVGALGFVDAYLELRRQCRDASIAPSAIVHATSSGGTQAGLEATRQLLGDELKVVGVAVAKTPRILAREVKELTEGVLELILGSAACRAATPIVRDGFNGEGYSVPTAGASRALAWLAADEGIVTDPVYSAKALHGLLDLEQAELGPGPVVFWHTGGVPALFSDEQGYASWSRLAAMAAGSFTP